MNARALGLTLGLLAAAQSAFAQDEREEGEHARRRWEWFIQQRAYPLTRVPAGAMDNARSQLTAMTLRARLLGPSSVVAPISGSTWQPLGPTLINPRDIGRTSVIAIHPTNSSVMYVGGAQGGVWKTTNAGATWTPLTDKQCSLAMGSIAIDPVNPEIVYAGTGEQHFSGDSYYGCGVLRTTDGGTTWTQAGAATMTTSGQVRPRISRVVIVPSTAGTVATTKLWAAADNGLWVSSDGGATWVRSRSGIATDVVLDVNNDNTVYAAMYGSGVFRSINGGSTWDALGAGFPTDSVARINLSVVKTATTTVLASVANSTTSVGLKGIYKTTDGAVSWTKLSASGANCAPQCWYDMLIAAHPTDGNIIYFGGVTLYKSINAGLSFTPVMGSGGNSLHSDQHFLTFGPQDPSKVFVTNDGGVFQSVDAGASWTTLNNGLSLTQFYPGMSLHPTDPLVVLAGTQDNGTLLTTGGTTWTRETGGDGGFTAIDPVNPATRYHEFQWPNGMLRTDNNGLSYLSKNNGINLGDQAQFIPPLVIDPTDARTLYFGTNRIYRTTDRADNWVAFSPQFSGTVTTIAPAPSAPSIVYAATSAGQLQVGINGTWTLRNSGLPNRVITDIAVDRMDSLTAYATLSGFATTVPGGHVYRTVNGGVTWTNVSASLPDMPFNAVALDPVNRAFVMIGTDLGVFVSADSGSTWTALTDGMPNVAVFDIAYNPLTGALVAATHGRGMFRLQLNRPLTVGATPLNRRTDVVEGGTTAVPDSSSVVLSGLNAGTSGWTATHTAAATWISLTTAAGTGSGRVVWSRNPTGLAAGMKVDTITISVAGATDSPLLIIDSLNVCSATPTMAADVTRRGTSLAAGLPPTAPDSALISFECGNGSTAWTATAKSGNWISFTTGAGNGPGRVRWLRRTDSLVAGLHRDTILVTATATGSPVKIADSVIVSIAPQFAVFSRTDTMVSGTAAPRNVSTALTIYGDSGAAAWTMTHKASATWTTLTTPNGTGNGLVQWSKNVASLAPGTYFDTITVTMAGATPLKFPDHLVVTAPAFTRTCAVNHFFGGASCLDATALKFLDVTGNNDGTFNLGDFLAYLVRTPAATPPSGAKP